MRSGDAVEFLTHLARVFHPLSNALPAMNAHIHILSTWSCPDVIDRLQPCSSVSLLVLFIRSHTLLSRSSTWYLAAINQTQLPWHDSQPSFALRLFCVGHLLPSITVHFHPPSPTPPGPGVLAPIKVLPAPPSSCPSP